MSNFSLFYHSVDLDNFQNSSKMSKMSLFSFCIDKYIRELKNWVFFLLKFSKKTAYEDLDNFHKSSKMSKMSHFKNSYSKYIRELKKVTFFSQKYYKKNQNGILGFFNFFEKISTFSNFKQKRIGNYPLFLTKMSKNVKKCQFL